MIQIGIFLIVFIFSGVLMGKYLYKITDDKKPFGDKFFSKIDNFIYKICGIEKSEMGFKKYVVSFILTNVVMMIIGYIILRVQKYLFLNPNLTDTMSKDLSFNTVISFMTNTNLQHYAGESNLSYLSQMVVITFMMFTSAASGYCVCMAFVRGITGRKNFGNYFRDMVRIVTRVLIPFSIGISILLVSQGVPQNLSKNVTVETVEGKYQDIQMGPIASLESIKHLGTNGGGFMSANSASPLENPNIVTNFIEMVSMTVLPMGCLVAFGFMAHSRRKKALNKEKRKYESIPIFVVMLTMFIFGLAVLYISEKSGNPLLKVIGLNQAMGNMEGKEVRFGIINSALFSEVTTAFTTGSVNNMHDSLTPLGGAIPLLNMMLNLVFGGKGVGLMNMIIYVLLTVFICGLMIGKTPEYLGKKIEGKEMRLVALAIIVQPLLILGSSAIALVSPEIRETISNGGAHGITQVVYEFTTSAANNGSGFEGLLDNNVFWNISTGIVMFIGRYVPIILQLGIASLIMKKKYVNESSTTLKTVTVTFTIALLVIIIIFAALTFLPMFVLGPINEYLSM